MLFVETVLLNLSLSRCLSIGAKRVQDVTLREAASTLKNSVSEGCCPVRGRGVGEFAVVRLIKRLQPIVVDDTFQGAMSTSNEHA
jgi:hypothetical protein